MTQTTQPRRREARSQFPLATCPSAFTRNPKPGERGCAPLLAVLYILIACAATTALILILLHVIVWAINADFYTQGVVLLAILAYCFGLFAIFAWLVRRLA